MWQNGTRLTRDECVITIGENVLRSNQRPIKDAEAPGSGSQEGFLRSVLCRSEWSETTACILLPAVALQQWSAVLLLGG